jgi:succinoglycan biosynthesis transport protein ExoP
MGVRNEPYNVTYLLTNMLPILWRRRRAVYFAVFLAAGAAFAFYSRVGERYEPYTLLRVGQGIKDRSASATGGPFGENVDLVSRIDSLARIGKVDHVIRLAAVRVGPQRLFQDSEANVLSKLRQAAADLDYFQLLPAHFDWGSNKQSGMAGAQSDTNNTTDLDQEGISTLRDLIIAKPEGRSDLLRISFRHPDPAVAAEFLNELANALVATQADLVQVPGADIFFQQQSKRLELEAEKAGSDLRNFSISAAIYSVADQRSLLLKRADELGSQIATTRGSMEDRKGQRKAIADQLHVLRPVNQSKTVTGIVNNLRGRDAKDVENTVGNVPAFEEAPPLLLVKVYQDAMASLLKANTDLNGLLRLETLLVSELEKINLELATLSSKEAEYERLKRVLTRASAAADHYGSRLIEEQINQDIAKKAQLSSVRVVQVAEKPIQPVFPRLIHLVALALVGGAVLGAAIALMLEHARMRRQAGDVDSVTAIDEVVKRSVRHHLREIQAAE